MSFGAGTSNTSGNTDTAAILNQLYNQATQQNQSSTVSRALTPEQQQAQRNIAKTANQLTSNPQAFIAPQQNQAREQVNQNYAGLGENLRQQFLSGGGGSSGKYGTAALSGDLARRAQLSQVDQSAAAAAPQLAVTGAGLSENLLGQNFGQTQTSTGGTTTTGGQSSSGVTNAQQNQSTNGAQGGFKI